MERAAVPCNGCTACCHNEAIILHPEHGDMLASYQTDVMTSTKTCEQVLILRQREDGACVYLGEHGCTIHDRAPYVCREFDCRAFYRQLTRPERRELVRRGFADKRVFDAARERMDTL